MFHHPMDPNVINMIIDCMQFGFAFAAGAMLMLARREK